MTNETEKQESSTETAVEVMPVVSCEYCAECGGFINWDKSKVLLSSPVKYKGECRDCKHIAFEKCSAVDAAN